MFIWQQHGAHKQKWVMGGLSLCPGISLYDLDWPSSGPQFPHLLDKNKISLLYLFHRGVGKMKRVIYILTCLHKDRIKCQINVKLTLFFSLNKVVGRREGGDNGILHRSLGDSMKCLFFPLVISGLGLLLLSQCFSTYFSPSEMPKVKNTIPPL